MNALQEEPITGDQVKLIHTLAGAIAKTQPFTEDSRRDMMQGLFGVRSSKDLTKVQATQFIKQLKSLEDAPHFKPAQKPVSKKKLPQAPADPDAPIKETQQHVIDCFFQFFNWSSKAKIDFTRRIVKQPWPQTHRHGQKIIYALIASLAGDLVKAIRALRPESLTEWELRFMGDAEEKLIHFIQQGRKRGHRTMPKVSMTKLFEILEKRN